MLLRYVDARISVCKIALRPSSARFEQDIRLERNDDKSGMI